MAVGYYLFAAFAPSYISVKYFHKTKMTSLLVPPASVRGMKSLDPAAFTTIVDVSFILLRNTTISKVIPTLKKYLLKIRNFKPVQNSKDGTMVYLNPSLVQDFTSIAENDRQQLSGLYDHFGKTKITLTYDNFGPKEILRAVLPETIDVPTSYSIVGHIIHLNLGDEHEPYKNLIGKVYLDHLANARTIVNKVNNINTTYRHFAMEILAGDNDTVVTVKENGYTYKFDFAQVYWNPRLSTEHKTLVDFMKKGDVLYDVFAGIGPFAIPAGKKGITVLANDLNPESFKWLQSNAKMNKVTKDFKTFNMDGRDFLRNIVKPDLLDRRAKNATGTEHIAMNLPALAIEFLDVLSDWFTKEEAKKICSKPPMIHVYCFVKTSKGEDECMLARKLVEQKLDYTFDSEDLVDLHYVRNVAPNKEMIRVSFLLNEKILKNEEPATKKQKVEHSGNRNETDIAEKNGEEKGLGETAKGEECIQSSNST